MARTEPLNFKTNFNYYKKPHLATGSRTGQGRVRPLRHWGRARHFSSPVAFSPKFSFLSNLPPAPDPTHGYLLAKKDDTFLSPWNWDKVLRRLTIPQYLLTTHEWWGKKGEMKTLSLGFSVYRNQMFSRLDPSVNPLKSWVLRFVKFVSALLTEKQFKKKKKEWGLGVFFTKMILKLFLKG